MDIKRIKTKKIAYRIGFSCALSFSASSGYKEMLKQPFDNNSEILNDLQNQFLKGFKHGNACFLESFFELKNKETDLITKLRQNI